MNPPLPASLAFALALAGCAQLSASVPHDGHARSPAPTPPSQREVPGAASSVARTPQTAPPPAAEPTYSVTVRNMAVEPLLFAIARDANLDLDLHPGLSGSVTLNAVGQSLPALLARIARQANLRVELDGQHLVVRPDAPFLRSYTLDYVNLTRTMSGTVATSTQIATSSSAMARPASTTGNASITQIETRAVNQFWESIAANVRALLDEGGSPPRAEGGDDHRLMVNRETGVLMVRASARQHESIRHFLDQVQNASRRQVMIEATIVEVTLADAYHQGIDWTRLGLPGWSIRPRGSGDAGITTQPTISYLSGQLDIRLELLETFGTVKVLSSPRLSVLNNQTAMLKVVEEVVYFLVDASTTEYDESKREKTTATTTPQSVSVGMVMSVTPQVSAGGDITLNVRPTISGISGFKDDPNPSLGSIPNRVPQIRTREIESVMRLRSGEVGVLGGLMEDRIDYGSGRIPLLGDIPLLGEAVTRRDNTVRRTELLIFLRPLLIEDPSTNGDYAAYRKRLPGADFLSTQPAPGERNFPQAPLRPGLPHAAAPQAGIGPTTIRVP
ncbi:MAG: general secretion pathway protein GspD [Thauera sp.]|nr:general secretion pathway protein GspD [Thauera sp.]